MIALYGLEDFLLSTGRKYSSRSWKVKIFSHPRVILQGLEEDPCVICITGNRKSLRKFAELAGSLGYIKNQ